MKHAAFILGCLIIIAATIAAGVGSYRSHDYHLQTMPHDDPMIMDEVIILPDPDPIEIISEVPLVRTSEFVNLTFEEMDLLEQIAMSEARGEGSVGMALVMRVVLNRSLKDGTSIRDTIYKDGAFYTDGMMPGNDECHEALAMVMDGWDETQGALFFSARGYSAYGEPLFQYGNHYFSR